MSARSVFGGDVPIQVVLNTATADRLPLCYIPEDSQIEPTAGARVGLELSGEFTFSENGGAGAFPAVEYSIVAIATQSGGQHVTITVPGTDSSVNLTGGSSSLDAALPAEWELPAGEWVVGTVSYNQGSTLIGYVSINGATICLHPIAGTFSAGALTFSGFAVTYNLPPP